MGYVAQLLASMFALGAASFGQHMLRLFGNMLMGSISNLMSVGFGIFGPPLARGF